jgi:hypothetical protein
MDLHLFAELVEEALDHKKGFGVPDVLAVDGIKKAFTEGKVIDRVQQIGLSHAIIAHKTVDLFGESFLERLVIFEVYER